ncbi:hypothetical protein ACFVVX_19345 [Kitasatospora sp. NPDC058170]|uniref:hypothetical protein n=1 Tax=Kitasatospora sp. NPDC058170 TaxID=3346364 RepID=UPI0036D83958
MRRTVTRTIRGLAGAATAATLAAVGVLAVQGTAHATYDAPTASIWDDEELRNDGGHVDNPGNGTARLVMQPDGNLVAYYAPDHDWSRQYPTWASGTVGCGVRAVMRADGNLVVLDPSGGLCWESGTAGHPHARLTLWRSGDLLITDTCNRLLWERQPGTSYVRDQLHGPIHTPDSTESPYVILPVPSGC